MGIRVDKDSLINQLTLSNNLDRLDLPFHKSLINNELPLTLGGGIGQSRICLVMLEKVHIGGVQASLWPAEILSECEAKGITLL